MKLKNKIGLLILFIAFTVAFMHVSEILAVILGFTGSTLFLDGLFTNKV